MSDYNFRPGGSLKLKGDKDGAKKKKKKRTHGGTDVDGVEIGKKRKNSNVDGDNAETITKGEQSKKPKLQEGSASASQPEGNAGDEIASRVLEATPSDSDAAVDDRTEAQKRFEESQRKRLEERVAKLAKKTHKDRVSEFNRKLEALSEHHDIPKVGPG